MHNATRSIVAAAAAAACLLCLAPALADDITYYTPPKFKHQVQPVYPDSARAARETGSVLVKVLVGADGKPKQFILFRSSGHKDLDNAVLVAAKASTYLPATRGTTPTIGFYDVTYKFTLTGIAESEGESTDLAKKLDANPRDVSARVSLGTVYLNQKNFSQAEDTFHAGTQLMPTNAKLWSYEGLAYFQDAQANSNDANKFKSSVDAFDQAIKLDPHVALANVAGAAYFNYGFHLQQTGDYADALQYAQKAVAIDPKGGQNFILLGEVQTSQSDFASAISTFKRAESLDDKKTPVVTSRIIADEGNAELMQGDEANGRADISRAEQVDPQALFAYEYLFSYYNRKGNHAAALTPLTQLARLQPNEPEWQVAIGSQYLAQNNAAAAREAFQKAMQLNPTDLDAKFGMAQIDAQAGDTKTLATDMQALTSKADPKIASIYNANIAVQLINASQNGKTDYSADAQKYADSATKSDPNNAEAWYALGVADAQVNRGDKSTASAALKKAFDLFKAQNNPDGMKQVDAIYKQINGSDITGYSSGSATPGH